MLPISLTGLQTPGAQDMASSGAEPGAVISSTDYGEGTGSNSLVVPALPPPCWAVLCVVTAGPRVRHPSLLGRGDPHPEGGGLWGPGEDTSFFFPTCTEKATLPSHDTARALGRQPASAGVQCGL